MEAARVNLGFTRLTSPIDGIAGQGPGADRKSGKPVQRSRSPRSRRSIRSRPNFTVSEQEYLELRAAARNDLGRLQLELILADGTMYPHKGKFSFADREVDQSTGAILLIGQFPNPGNILRPGQYAKVRAVVGTRAGCFAGAATRRDRIAGHLSGRRRQRVTTGFAIAHVKAGDRVGPLWIDRRGPEARAARDRGRRA